MGTQQLTEENASVLLWLKVLDEFKGEGFENATFDEKFDAFEAVEDTGISREDYDKSVKFWKTSGVIGEDELTHEYYVTGKGKELFNKLDEMKNDQDETTRKASNKLLSLKDLSAICAYIKEHPQEIMMVIGIALQVVQICVAI